MSLSYRNLKVCRSVRCSHSNIRVDDVTFRNGTKHKKQVCSDCGRFLKFGGKVIKVSSSNKKRRVILPAALSYEQELSRKEVLLKYAEEQISRLNGEIDEWMRAEIYNIVRVVLENYHGPEKEEDLVLS